MATDVINNDMHVNGSFAATSMTIPSGSVTNTGVAAAAGIDVTKVDHLIIKGTNFGLENDVVVATSTTYTFTVFQAAGAATVRLFKASFLDLGSAGSSHNYTFDLKKAAVGSDSPSSILSATVPLDSANETDNTPTAGSLSSTALVAGDSLVIELVTPGTVTGAHGPFAWVEVAIGAN